MNEIQAITGTLTALRTAGDLIKVVYEAKLSSDVKVQLSSVLDALFDARQAALKAQDELAFVKETAANLEREVMKFKQWGDDKARYQLYQPEGVGGVVYALKESDSGGEPAHYLCTSCYQKSQKSILSNYELPSKFTAFRCPACKSETPTRYRGSVPAKFPPA